MGKLLQIRVSASTYRPEDVERAWPQLTSLALPQGVEKTSRFGVLELVEALSDRFRFGDLPEPVKQELEPGISRTKYVKHQLEEALAEWDASKANELSDELEQILDEMEKAVRP
jgi:hypothetical protein